MENQANQPPVGTQPNNSNKGKKVLIIVVVLVLLLALAGGAYYLLQSPEGSAESSPTPSISMETPAPTSTPEVISINKEDVTIEVLNGSGIAGEAGFLQKELEELGYTDIEVGNADEQDQETTQLFMSSEFAQSDAREELVAKLESLYNEVEVTEDAPDDFDVRIITGLRTGQTAQPSSTNTPAPTSRTTSPTPTATPEE